MNPINPAEGPKAAIVQQASKRQACQEFARVLAKDEAKRAASLKQYAADDKAALLTKWHFGQALHDLMKDVPHGQHLAEYEAIGITSQQASECMRIALVSRMKIEELGSQRAVLRYLDERKAEEERSNSGRPEFDDDEETPETGEGAAPTAAKPPGGSPKPTAPSPAGTSEQQSLPGMEKPEDAEAAKKRLDKKTRSQARGLAARLAEIHKEFEQLMRCKDAPVTEEIRRLYRLSGLHIEDRQPPEVASGFEGRQEPVGVCWRELESAQRRLEEAAGKDT